jgi:hypothetical protein
MKMRSPCSTAVSCRAGDNQGLALVATLIVLAVIGVVIAGAVRSALTTLRTSGLDHQEARVFYAAEAGGEAALAQLKVALQDGLLEDAELLTISPPALEGFSFDSFAVQRLGTAVVEDITDGPYAGLYALTQKVDIYSLATDANQSVAGVVLRAKAQAIPLFQFGVFFEEDLEATNGPPMEFIGRVHSNGNIYLSSRNAWYREPITTPNRVFHNRKDHNRVYDGVFINDSEANEVTLDFDSRSVPGAEAFKAESCAKFDCRLMTDAFGVDSLKLPLPTGVPAYELIMPREADDGDSEKSVKFAWNADTYVTIDFSDMNPWSSACSLYEDGDEVWIPSVKVTRPGGRPVPNPSQLCSMFRWQWSAFYDGREDELKDIVQVDITEIANWVGGDASRAMELIYIDIQAPKNLANIDPETRKVVIDGSIDPAVRITRGAELPNPLTIATEWPLYVWRDYNIIMKKPAAVAADGITILSRAWLDDVYRRPDQQTFEDCVSSAVIRCWEFDGWITTSYRVRVSAETTVNAAVLAGHWPTPCDWMEPGCPADGSDSYYQDWYGGGIENFPRFLERWESGSKVIFHYLGALISPFTSQKTTGKWNGTYYVPPQRDWSFDTDFRDPEKLPPGTPNVGNVIRTAMREAF